MRGAWLVLLLCFGASEQINARSTSGWGVIHGLPALHPTETDLRCEALRGEADPLVLAAALSDSSVQVRRTAALYLAHIDSEASPAREALARALEDEDSTVRARAVQALWNTKAAGDSLYPLLRRIVRQDEGAGPVYAFRLLCHSGQIDLPEMLDALDSENLRGVAAAGLVEFGSDAAPAVPALIELVLWDQDERSKGPNYRSRATTVGAPVWTEASALEALAGIGPAALPELLRTIEECDAADRARDRELEERCSDVRSLSDAISGMGPAAAPAAPRLAAILEQSPRRFDVIRAISQIGAEAIPEIEQLLRHAFPQTRIAALRVVDGMGTTAAFLLDSVTPLVEDPDPAVRSCALQTWARLDSVAAFPIVLSKAREEVGDVRRSAIHLLGRMNGEAARTTPLLVTLIHDPEVGLDAITALGQLRSDPDLVVPALSMMVEEKDGPARGRAILALSQFGPAAASAAPQLSQVLEDPSAGVHAAAALASTRATASLPALLHALPTAIARDRADLADQPGQSCWHSRTRAFVAAIQTLDSCAATPQLLELLTSTEPMMLDVATSALWASARSCSLPLEELHLSLQHSPEPNRSAHFRILGNTRDRSLALRLALEGLADTSAGIRWSATEVIAAQCSSSRECSDLLLSLLAAPDPYSRAFAAAQLARLEQGPARLDDDRIDAALELALGDPDSEVRKNAEWALRSRFARQRDAARRH